MGGDSGGSGGYGGGSSMVVMGMVVEWPPRTPCTPPCTPPCTHVPLHVPHVPHVPMSVHVSPNTLFRALVATVDLHKGIGEFQLRFGKVWSYAIV